MDHWEKYLEIVWPGRHLWRMLLVFLRTGNVLEVEAVAVLWAEGHPRLEARNNLEVIS